ncbi:MULTISPECIES: hypothetical protein [Frankia]|uniref:Uncharacterized protein n=1 Tax=Frankia alni (strain DSM 45986 / CECT 9034 / ACN14a) TaxID=326424 RepID=Q0RU11_FRAAA|nr:MULTISPECIES: hypothetical protein [Frankia]CAJ58933.1 hypothetical protein FRAAL0256 [Frankia alni ACN14a]
MRKIERCAMWKFVENEKGWLKVDPADHFPEGKLLGIRDWLEDDIQHSLRSLELFRDDWRRVRSGECEGTAGNSTEQTLVGDEVLFESLYERWDDFAMPLAEMYEILDRYEDFLRERAARRRQAAAGG